MAAEVAVARWKTRNCVRHQGARMEGRNSRLPFKEEEHANIKHPHVGRAWQSAEVLLLPNLTVNILFIYLRSRKGKGLGDPLQMSGVVGLGRGQSREPGTSPSLPLGRQESSHVSHRCCFAGLCVSMKLESGARGGHGSRHSERAAGILLGRRAPAPDFTVNMESSPKTRTPGERFPNHR